MPVSPRRRPPIPISKARSSSIEVTGKGLVAAALALVLGILWLQALTAKQSPAGASTDTVYTEASVRWAIAIQSRRIDDFIRTYRRAPITLAEIGGSPWDAISYERVDVRRYRLIAPGPSHAIVYDSVESLEAFVGKSKDFLRPAPGERAP